MQADHTLLVSGLPPAATSSAELGRRFADFGPVSHSVVALANRELLLRMPARQALLQSLHDAQARRPRPAEGQRETPPPLLRTPSC